MFDEAADDRRANTRECACRLCRHGDLRRNVVAEFRRVVAGRVCHERETRVIEILQFAGRVDPIRTLVTYARIDIAGHERAEDRDGFVAAFRCAHGPRLQ